MKHACGSPVRHPLPSAIVGVPYTVMLMAEGGALPYTRWEVRDGSLPEGLTLDISTGEISGTATRNEEASFTVELEDTDAKVASETFVLFVARPALLNLSTPSSYDFGLTSVGSASSHLFVVRNAGEVSATGLGSSPSLVSPFSFTGGAFPGLAGTCVDGGELPAGGACSLDIEFAPTTATSGASILSIAYHDGVSNIALTLNLIGRGTTGLWARQVVTGDAFTCAVLTDRTVKCWGRNTEGQLGYGDVAARGDTPGELGANLLPVDLGAGARVKRLAASATAVCALLLDHRIKCWGDNPVGQLGLGDVNRRGDDPNEMGDLLPYVDLGTGRRVSNIWSGDSGFCTLLDDFGLKCWGHNLGGTLGLGDINNRGDEPGEMGDALPYVDLGTGRVALQVAGAETSSCALLDNGQVKCWGEGIYGELGLEDLTARGDNPDEMGDALPAIDLGGGETIKQIAGSTQWHVCALLEDGSVKCWGRNNRGQLGQGDIVNRGDLPNTMGDDLVPIDLGTGRTAQILIAGISNGCTILDNGALKCWGYNVTGRLGLGDDASRGDHPNEMGDSLPEVSLGTGVRATSIEMSRHACAILTDDTIKCWGSNTFGQLGLGDTLNRGDEPGEMGDALPRVDIGLHP